jgi:hypothetical protein
MQPLVPALHSAWGGVGYIFSGRLPTDIVALGTHEGDEFVLASGVPHTLINGIDEPELPTLALGGDMIFRRGHGLHLFLLALLEHRQAEYLAHLIVALTKLDQLRLTDMKLSPIFQRDAIYNKV